MAEESKNLKKLTSDMDIISSLHEDIIESILAFLPLKDVVRTSILSRDWSCKWRYIPDLVFDTNLFPFRREKHKIVHTVDRVLSLHRGYIRKFEFSTSSGYFIELNEWLRHLVGAHVQELVLNFPCEGSLHAILTHNHIDRLIPPSLFLFDKLATLKFEGHYLLKLPPSFSGYKSLTTLVLKNIQFSFTTLERLTQMCPLLKNLSIAFCFGSKILKIRAPNLRSLDVLGWFSYLNISDNSVITSVSISILLGSSIIVDLIGLASVVDLRLLAHTLTGFGLMDYIFSRHEIKFKMMKTLHLTWCVHSKNQNKAIFNILRRSPALENLHIQCHYFLKDELPTNKMFWEVPEPDGASIKFDRLKIFVLRPSSKDALQLKLMEYVLGNAPLLEKINVNMEFRMSFDTRIGILHKISSFKRASASAAKVYIENR